MSRIIDLTGHRFGHLLVIKRAPIVCGEKPKWICQCDCGNTTVVWGAVLKRGDTKSCGCIHGKSLIQRRTHANRLYNIWVGIKYRCQCETCQNYKLYGGRGICICEEWSEPSGFESFANWSLENGYKDTLEIDRIDNDGNYEPSNCRWVSHELNSQNRGRKGDQKGISFRKSRTGTGGSYRASISFHSKNINLGDFPTLDRAVEARKQAELDYWGYIKTK